MLIYIAQLCETMTPLMHLCL